MAAGLSTGTSLCLQEVLDYLETEYRYRIAAAHLERAYEDGGGIDILPDGRDMWDLAMAANDAEASRDEARWRLREALKEAADHVVRSASDARKAAYGPLEDYRLDLLDGQRVVVQGPPV